MNDEAYHRNSNQTQAVSPKHTAEQKGKQPMVYDNRNKIAVNKQKILDWVPQLRGSFSAESKSVPARPAVQPVARPNSKPRAISSTGSKAVKSDSTSKSVASSSKPQTQPRLDICSRESIVFHENQMNKSKAKKKKKTKTKTNVFVKPQQIWKPKSESNSSEASSSGTKSSEPPTPAGSWVDLPILDDLGRRKTIRVRVLLSN